MNVGKFIEAYETFLQALLDICANEGWLQASLMVMTVIQMCVQGRWSHDSSLLCLPHVEEEHVDIINRGLTRLAVGLKLIVDF